MTSNPFAVWVQGELVQHGAWSVGGGAGLGRVPEKDAEGKPLREVDTAFSRDGKGRLTLSGSALAGSFCDLASKITSSGALTQVTGKHGHPSGNGAGSHFNQSAWRFFHSHPILKESAAKPLGEKRSGVGIIHKTGAASGKEGEGALFDAEVTPSGTRWPFTMRIDVRAGGAQVEWLAREVLRDWVAGMGWVGAGAARGMGWLKLAEVSVVRLPLTVEGLDCDTAMDGSVAELQSGKLSAVPAGDSLNWQEWLNVALPAQKTARWWRAALEVTISAGARADGWGLDALSVGGHEGQNEKSNDEASAVARLARSGGKVYVPGSSMRGPLRHGGAALLRGSGHEIIDPVDDRESEAKHPFDQLFGVLKSGSRLLVRDGLATATPLVEKLERHAEDEFSASTYKGAKYTVEAVLQGEFSSRLVIEARTAEELGLALEQLRGPLQLAELGQLPMGGDAFAGNGWPTWRFHGLRIGRFGCGDLQPRPGKEAESVAAMLRELQPAFEVAAALDVIHEQRVFEDHETGPGTGEEDAPGVPSELREPVGAVAMLVAKLAKKHTGPWLLTLEPAQGPDRRSGFAKWYQPGDTLPGGEYVEAQFHFHDGLIRIAATAQGTRSWAVCTSTEPEPDERGVGKAAKDLGLAPPQKPDLGRVESCVALVRGDFERFGLQRRDLTDRVKMYELIAENGGRLAWHFDPPSVLIAKEG